MAKVTVWKASGQIHTSRTSPDLHIEATEPIECSDNGDGWEARTRKIFSDEATKIVDALCTSLPGGTVDAILAELCLRKASILHVSLVVPTFKE